MINRRYLKRFRSPETLHLGKLFDKMTYILSNDLTR